jgi:DNA-binding IclR family transcriptional regulator
MNASVKSAVRTLRILELFAASDRPLTLKDVTSALGLPKSSAHMLIATLLAEGYLAEADGGGITLGIAGGGGWVGGVAGAILRAAGPEMDRLLARFQESVVLGMLTPGLDVRLVASRQSPLAVRYDVSRDPVLAGWCTAMGHAMLACLPEEAVRAYLDRTPRVPLTARTVTDADGIIAKLRGWRAAGHALNIAERFDGASGAAVAIRDHDGRPHAAINLVTLTPRFRSRQTEIVAALAQAARTIETTVFPGRRTPVAAQGG